MTILRSKYVATKEAYLRLRRLAGGEVYETKSVINDEDINDEDIDEDIDDEDIDEDIDDENIDDQCGYKDILQLVFKYNRMGLIKQIYKCVKDFPDQKFTEQQIIDELLSHTFDDLYKIIMRNCRSNIVPLIRENVIMLTNNNFKAEVLAQTNDNLQKISVELKEAKQAQAQAQHPGNRSKNATKIGDTIDGLIAESNAEKEEIKQENEKIKAENKQLSNKNKRLQNEIKFLKQGLSGAACEKDLKDCKGDLKTCNKFKTEFKQRNERILQFLEIHKAGLEKIRNALK